MEEKKTVKSVLHKIGKDSLGAFYAGLEVARKALGNKNRSKKPGKALSLRPEDPNPALISKGGKFYGKASI